MRFWLALKQSEIEKKIPIVTTLSSIRHGTVEEWPVRIVGAQISKGGKKFIGNNSPLVIFEYNKVSKRYFNLEDVQIVLGKNYKIYCLKSDGYLDENYDDTWNIVAVHSNSPFFTVVISMVR